MNAEILKEIENYLSGKLTKEECQQFEERLQQSKELSEQTKMVAYIIHSLRTVGLKNDNARIKQIKAGISSDNKRYIISVAAMLAVILSFAAVVSVPVYKHVIKPTIEKIFHHKLLPSKEIHVAVQDTMALLYADTIPEDSVVIVVDSVITPSKPAVKKEIEKPKEELKVTLVKMDKDTIPVIRKDTVVKDTIQKVSLQSKPEPKNRIVSYSLLKNYQFGEVEAKREGDNVVCCFTMKNIEEDAEIQMHSARAKDGNGRNYPAKSCLLNGQSKRIIEKWKKDEIHLITITIIDVPENIPDFQSISFSFQSEGESLRQKSQSIILKVGAIN